MHRAETRNTNLQKPTKQEEFEQIYWEIVMDRWWWGEKGTLIFGVRTYQGHSTAQRRSKRKGKPLAQSISCIALRDLPFRSKNHFIGTVRLPDDDTVRDGKWKWKFASQLRNIFQKFKLFLFNSSVISILISLLHYFLPCPRDFVN